MHKVGDLVLFVESRDNKPSLGVIKKVYLDNSHGIPNTTCTVEWFDGYWGDYSSATIEEFKADLLTHLGEL